MPSGLNSPYEVYFFTKTPDEYKAATNPYFYEIDWAEHERVLELTKTTTRSRTLLKIIHFDEPTVEVHDDAYNYIVRSKASREAFQTVMSPESIRDATTVRRGIRGLHYSAAERSGDAIGIAIRASTPEEAKQQFQAWHAKIKDALNSLSERFAAVNQEMNKKIDEAATKRLDEIQRAKKVL